MYSNGLSILAILIASTNISDQISSLRFSCFRNLFRILIAMFSLFNSANWLIPLNCRSAVDLQTFNMINRFFYSLWKLFYWKMRCMNTEPHYQWDSVLFRVQFIFCPHHSNFNFSFRSTGTVQFPLGIRFRSVSVNRQWQTPYASWCTLYISTIWTYIRFGTQLKSGNLKFHERPISHNWST